MLYLYIFGTYHYVHPLTVCIACVIVHFIEILLKISRSLFCVFEIYHIIINEK